MQQIKPITTLDEFEAERRKGIGEWWPQEPRIKEASLESIRRFADGIGDYNPLWIDEEYASKSRFGMITAPPTFVFSRTIGSSVADIGTIDPARISTKDFPTNYSGADLEFFRPIWLGDKIHIKQQVGNCYRKQSQRLGPIIFCEGLIYYYNQRQELVATLKTLMARFKNIGSGMKYEREPKGGHIPEPADPLVWERKRRGAETRYWDDVEEGEEIPTLKKGTYSVSELFYWTIDVSGAPRSTRAKLEKEGSVDLGGAGRFDAEHALKRRNMPGQFDIGPQRICWLAQIVTDWMGDEGTLKKLFSSIRHPNIVGDTNTVYGKVTKKYTEDGEHLVEVEMWNMNQAELVTASGRAIVTLPSRCII